MDTIIIDLTLIINVEEIFYTAESKIRSEVMLTQGQRIISIQEGDKLHVFLRSFLFNPHPGFNTSITVENTGNLSYK